MILDCLVLAFDLDCLLIILFQICLYWQGILNAVLDGNVSSIWSREVRRNIKANYVSFFFNLPKRRVLWHFIVSTIFLHYCILWFRGVVSRHQLYFWCIKILMQFSVFLNGLDEILHQLDPAICSTQWAEKVTYGLKQLAQSKWITYKWIHVARAV